MAPLKIHDHDHAAAVSGNLGYRDNPIGAFAPPGPFDPTHPSDRCDPSDSPNMRVSRHGLRRLAFAAMAALFAGAGWIVWGQSRPAEGELRFEVVASWGLRGVQPGELHFPRAVEPALDGSLFVVDRSGRVQRFSREGKMLANWRLPEWDNGTPTGMSLTPDGRLAVADCHYSRVLIYDPDGRLVEQFGEYGEGTGQMVFVTDVAAGPEGGYFVTEFGRHERVQQYDSAGRFLREWGGHGMAPGQMKRPMSLAFDPQGRLWVADADNDRLQVFTAGGELLFTVGGRGAGMGQLYYPYDLAIDGRGRVYVAEYGNNRVQVFSDEGRSLGWIGGPGREPGRFASPWGVNVDKDGVIWVADTLNHRVQGVRAKL